MHPLQPTMSAKFFLSFHILNYSFEERTQTKLLSFSMHEFCSWGSILLLLEYAYAILQLSLKPL